MSVAAGKEVLWMRTLLDELKFNVEDASPMMMDNRLALVVMKNPEYHSHMKHIQISYHWIHQVVKRKQIAPYFIPTGKMTADILTKALARLLIERHHLKMGVM